MVRIRVNPLREKGLLCIRVVDNGVGIQLDQLRQLRGALSQPVSAGSISAFIMLRPACVCWIGTAAL